VTQNQKRIIIAKHLGFKEEVGVTGMLRWRDKGGTLHNFIPKYFSELNTSNQAENLSIDKLDESFYIILEQLCYKDRGLGDSSGRLAVGFSGWIAHASAANHAEALGLALGLWTD
jgi:hypothetical protein